MLHTQTKHIFPLILVLLMWISDTQALQPYMPKRPDPFTETWRWTTYPELKGHGLRCLTQTTDGAMWFGTDEGICQEDG